MKSTNGLTSIQEIFSFSFRDPRWKQKFLIGAGVAFAGVAVPVLPWLALLGYGARVARAAAAQRVARRGSPAPVMEADALPASPAGMEDASAGVEPSAVLPEWDLWNELFADGLRQFGVGLVVSLPLVVMVSIMYGFYFFLQFIIVTQSNSADTITVPLLSLVGVVVFFIAMAITMVIAPVTYLFLPAAAVHVAVTRSFSEFFRADWLRNLRRNLGGYLALLFFLGGLYIALVLATQVVYFTIVLCFLLPVLFCLTAFYVTILFYHTGGMAYAGGEP